MSVLSNFLSGMYTNVSIDLDHVNDGRRVLHDLLMQLQERLPGQRQDVQDVATTMQIAVGDVFERAYKDFDQFIADWSFEYRVWRSISETNIITIKMRERNKCPREFEFKFTHLERFDL